MPYSAGNLVDLSVQRVSRSWRKLCQRAACRSVQSLSPGRSCSMGKKAHFCSIKAWAGRLPAESWAVTLQCGRPFERARRCLGGGVWHVSARNDNWQCFTYLTFDRLQFLGLNYGLYSDGDTWSEPENYRSQRHFTQMVEGFARLCFEPAESGSATSFHTESRWVGRWWESRAESTAVVKRSAVLRKCNSCVLANSMVKAWEGNYEEPGVQNCRIRRPVVQAAAAAVIDFVGPRVIDGTGEERQGRCHRRHRACRICGLAGGGDAAFSMLRDSMYLSAQGGLPKAIGAASIELCELIRQSAHVRLADSLDRLRGSRDDQNWENDWFSTDDMKAMVQRGGTSLNRRGHDHLLCPVVQTEKWYHVLWRET